MQGSQLFTINRSQSMFSRTVGVQYGLVGAIGWLVQPHKVVESKDLIDTK